MSEYVRVPPADEDLLVIDAPELNAGLKEELLRFNIEYQMKGFRFFAKLKLQWEKDHPGKTFPGLCAEVDSVIGKMRPLDQQRAWSWGDCRGLGIWSYFLIKGRIPSVEETIVLDGGEEMRINLLDFYNDYVDLMYRSLIERWEKSGGKLPHLVDIETNQASDDPRNLKTRDGEFTSSHIFAVAAFFNYGFLRNDNKALDLGWQALDETMLAAHENRFVGHLSGKRSFAHGHGGAMCGAGAVVDCLKTIELLESRGNTAYSGMKDDLVARTRWGLERSLRYHWNAGTKQFAEQLHPITCTPYAEEGGYIRCDPGHTAEGVGFFSELYEYLPENDETNFAVKKSNMLPILSDQLLFVDEIGYAPSGVMYKAVDLRTKEGFADVKKDGREHRTAPWWNVREAAAAAMKMYQLTGDAKMWEVYKRAFNAAYKNYPNLNIGGLMIQTLDADTMEPLPYPPATGNLDPMHSPRAREHEIEALEKIKV